MVNRYGRRSNAEIARAEAEVSNRIYDTLAGLTERSIPREYWPSMYVLREIKKNDPQKYEKLRLRDVEATIRFLHDRGLVKVFVQKIDHPWFKGEFLGYRTVKRV